ncbi:MAG: LPS assembly lipoprotein LptE, partial [Candidatus Desantisbacteria bacterium]
MRQSVVVRVFRPVIMQETGKNWRKLVLCSLLAICLSSCKHIPQQDTTAMLTNKNAASTTSLLPSSASCSVSMFTNESQQYGLEEVFTNLLIKEIVYDGRLDITSSPSSDLRIKGKILSYERSPVSYGENYINKYRLSMKIEIIILNCSNEVMEKKIFEDYMDFIPLSSPLTARGFVPGEEDEVVQELCQR